MGRMKLLGKVVNQQTGQVEGYCIIKSVQQKSNIKGSDYLDFILCDSEGEIAAKLWDYNPLEHGTYFPDTIVKVRASVNLWKETEQLKIDKIRNIEEDEEVDRSDLIPCAPYDAEWMFEELMNCASGFEDNDITRITQYLLKENKQDLLIYPAAVKLHHAMRSGLLYHTYTMLMVAKHICAVYPALDTDLVYAGIILHDLAKINELEVGNMGIATGYSKSGQLLGHINMGVSMIDRAGAELMIDQELLDLLEHIVLSHHDKPEFGSPKFPMFPEAEAVSEIDLLDARLYEMFSALENISAGQFSERQWSLDNRILYKHGHNQKEKNRK